MQITKFTATLALGLGLGTAALAQDDTLDPGEIVGITCGDFMMADAAQQMEYAEAFMGMHADAEGADVELSADAAADVQTIDDDVQALAAACNENEEELLTEVELVAAE